jgi:hypothetical protein
MRTTMPRFGGAFFFAAFFSPAGPYKIFRQRSSLHC